MAIDKSFEPAHKKLGHVYHGGYWVTRDELNAIQGLVKYKGRWMSAEERAQREAEDKLLAVKNEWVQRIKMLRQSILSSSTDRRREAESQLMAIREAEAVGALLRVLGNDEEPMRILLSQVLSVIPEEQATLGLVGRSWPNRARACDRSSSRSSRSAIGRPSFARFRGRSGPSRSWSSTAPRGRSTT